MSCIDSLRRVGLSKRVTSLEVLALDSPLKALISQSYSLLLDICKDIERGGQCVCIKLIDLAHITMMLLVE